MKLDILRTVASAAFIALVAVAAVAAPDDQEARALRSLAASQPGDAATQQKAAGLAALEQESARLNQSKRLSAESQAAIERDKAQGAAHRAAQIAATPAAARPSVRNPFVGIMDASDVPSSFKAGEFVPLNYWGGTLEGRAVGVFSGYRPAEPSKGVLVVIDSEQNIAGTFYDVPAAPMPIAAEAAGVLTLQSRSGRIRFDLATRQFVR